MPAFQWWLGAEGMLGHGDVALEREVTVMVKHQADRYRVTGGHASWVLREYTSSGSMVTLYRYGVETY